MGETERVATIVVQQPQLLPWQGLWFKVVSARTYVVYAGVKFNKYGHQNRVPLAGSWLTVPVEAGQRSGLICDVRVADPAWGAKAAKRVRQVCMGRRNPYHERLGPLVARLETYRSSLLLDWSNILMTEMAQAMGFSFDFALDTDPRAGKPAVEKLDACIAEHARGRRVLYLAGPAGLDYMGYASLSVPAETRFQSMNAGVDGNSVLQLIASAPDPVTVIRGCSCWLASSGARYRWSNDRRVDEDPA